jgi:hypothetical protein
LLIFFFTEIMNETKVTYQKKQTNNNHSKKTKHMNIRTKKKQILHMLIIRNNIFHLNDPVNNILWMEI